MLEMAFVARDTVYMAWSLRGRACRAVLLRRNSRLRSTILDGRFIIIICIKYRDIVTMSTQQTTRQQIRIWNAQYVLFLCPDAYC